MHSTNPDRPGSQRGVADECPPCRSPTGTRLGVGRAELDLVRLRELAAELGYWPGSTDEEHVARLRAQDARYDEQVAQDPDGTKWQEMMIRKTPSPQVEPLT